MKKIIVRFRSLLRNNEGASELVSILVGVGVAVTLGLIAITAIGTSLGKSAKQQGTSIEALPH